MTILYALVFSLLVADCASRFFMLPRARVDPITLLVFISLVPSALIIDGSLISPDIAVYALQALSPLIIATITFCLLLALSSLSIARGFGPLLKIFRIVWLAGFLILVIHKLTAITPMVVGKGGVP